MLAWLGATTALVLGACASPHGPVTGEADAPVAPATESLAHLMIEQLERRSNCRYRLLERSTPRPPARAVILTVSYRGPEVECRQGLEQLNRYGAPHGIVFLAERVRLAGGA